jgi:hypothetical protein
MARPPVVWVSSLKKRWRCYWQEAIFAVMERNAIHVSDFFSLPSDQVVEIGRQVSIQASRLIRSVFAVQSPVLQHL